MDSGHVKMMSSAIDSEYQHVRACDPAIQPRAGLGEGEIVGRVDSISGFFCSIEANADHDEKLHPVQLINRVKEDRLLS